MPSPVGAGFPPQSKPQDLFHQHSSNQYLWMNESISSNRAQPGLPADWPACSVPLPTAEKARLGAWNPQGSPDPLPSPFLLYLFTQVHLASPARRQGLSLGWTLIVIHSSAGLALPPKALQSPPYSGLTDPTTWIRNNISLSILLF